jgi:hypothetical protein
VARPDPLRAPAGRGSQRERMVTAGSRGETRPKKSGRGAVAEQELASAEAATSGPTLRTAAPGPQPDGFPPSHRAKGRGALDPRRPLHRRPRL